MIINFCKILDDWVAPGRLKEDAVSIRMFWNVS